MEKKIFLKLSPQNVVHVLDSLALYSDLITCDKSIINNLLSTINEQLNLQGINIYKNKQENLIGKRCIVNNVNINDLSSTKEEGVIIGVSDINNFIKVIVIRDGKFVVIDTPSNLIERIDKF